MKQILKSSLIIITFGALLSFIPNQEPKELTVHLSINEWNTVIIGLQSPDDVTVNSKKSAATKIVEQLQKQIADTTKKK